MKLFNQNQSDSPQFSTFDLSHENKLTLDMGKLVPIFVGEALPNDFWSISPEVFLRIHPTLAPIMHRVDVHLEAFFVPNRILWNNWEKFITGGDHGTLNPVLPFNDYKNVFNEGNQKLFKKGSLLDYMGLPTLPDNVTLESPKLQFNLLPFKAYNAIWNEFYRDENLQDAIMLETDVDGDGSINEDWLTIKRRCWEKDYFTSCLPTPQKGESVLLPLNGTINASNFDITYNNNGTTYARTANSQTLDNGNGSLTYMAFNKDIQDDPTPLDNKSKVWFDNDGLEANIDNSANLDITGSVNIGNATGQTTISDLREAVQLQRYLEKLMRGGSRYVEWLKSFFNATLPDATLQRPQMFGSQKFPLVVSEIPQTSATQDDSVQGNLAGKGLSMGKANNFTYHTPEHGYVIVLMSIMPKTAYQQGIHPMWTRNDRLDFAIPTFAHLGEQEIKTRELYWKSDTDFDIGQNNATFGYQSRYAEYKYIPSSVHGDMKDNMDYWHMGRKFQNSDILLLNGSFVESNPTTRIFPVIEDNERPVFGQVYNNITCRRALPYIGDPGYLDHF